MPSLISSEILNALTTNVRIISLTQAAKLTSSSDQQKTARTLRRLEKLNQVERVGGLMLPRCDVATPIFRWHANSDAAAPNFDQLAYQLKRRRSTDRTHATLWRATKLCFQEMNPKAQKRPARRADWEHDIGLTATWLHFRDEIRFSGAHWILEDDFVDESLDTFCKPDAIIRWAGGQTELIEYGGCYSANTLRLKFESWREFDWQLF